MKVLFVAPLDPWRPALGLMVLSAAVRARGHHSAAAGLSALEISRALDRHDFDVIAFSFPSCFARPAARLARQISRQFRGPILAGGPHATLFPEKVLAEPAFAAVCVGEAEQALPEALDNLAGHRPLGELAGWWTRSGETIQPGRLRPLATDLDEVPPADRDLLLSHLVFRDRLQPVQVSRGCTFACTYCFEPAVRRIFRQKEACFRTQSVERAIDELARVRRERDVRLNVFYDDTLNGLDRGWLETFFRLYAERIRVPFQCRIRPDILDADVTRLFAHAGCQSMAIGVETGNEALRARILGRPMEDAAIRRAARLIHDHGIKLATFNIAAIPGTTWRDDLATLDLNLALRPDFSSVSYLQPYAGTAIHRLAIKRGQWSEADDEQLQAAGLNLNLRSLLHFPDPAERRRTHNIHDLFLATLRWPRLRPLVPILARLPAGPIFARLNSLLFRRQSRRELYRRLATPAAVFQEKVFYRIPRLRPAPALLPPTGPRGQT